MPTRDWSSRLPWGGVLFMLVFGITTRDCILIASAALLTVYVARTRFTHGEALDMWRCAIRSWMVGGVSLVLALLLVIWVVGMHTGLWEGAGIDTPEMLWLLGLCVSGVGVATVSAIAPNQRSAEYIGFVTLSIAVLLGAFVSRTTDASGPCAFALGVAIVVAVSGWQLARNIGSELARSAARLS